MGHEAPGSVRRALGLLVVLAIGMAGCASAGSGEDLFASECARCHGRDRAGIAGLGPDLRPSSFALDESDEWLTGRIRDGFGDMPSFARVLTTGQTAIIISYLRGPSELVAERPATPPLPTLGTTAAPTDVVVATTSPGSAPPPPASSVPPPASSVPPAIVTVGNDDVLARGRVIFEVEAGGRGCADCHGLDATGTADGPNIIGVSKSAIAGALGGGVVDMEDIDLSPEDLEAVYRYVVFLTQSR